MSSKSSRAVTKQIAHEQHGPDEVLYGVARRHYAKKDFVSRVALQFHFRIGYQRAKYVMDKLIEDGFCEQIGKSEVYKVVRYKN